MEFVDTDKDGFLSFDEYKGKQISRVLITIF